jgi:hypothetical protein
MKKFESANDSNDGNRHGGGSSGGSSSGSSSGSSTNNQNNIMSKEEFSQAINEIQVICNGDRWYRRVELCRDLHKRNIKLNWLHSEKLRNQLTRRNNSVNIDEMYEYYQEDSK